jgi:hypothetical protein
MSATRDKSQKITFVYSNLYSSYRKGVERAREGAIRESDRQSPSAAAEALTELATGRPSVQSFESGVVIKARDAKVGQARPAAAPVAAPVTPRVSAYTPAELLGRRVSRPQTVPAGKANAQAVEGLKDNLKSLNDLQARLRFMLKELEELIKE